MRQAYENPAVGERVGVRLGSARAFWSEVVALTEDGWILRRL
jgi:hypothetical protein